MTEWTVSALAQAVRQGEESAESLATEAFRRLTAVGESHNAIAALTPDTALEAARAVDIARWRGSDLPPLAGVPMAHKELFLRAGRSSHCGARSDRAFVPRQTATALKRLDRAGAIDLGTLHMAEIAMSPTGFNLHHRHGLNPWNPEHISGGSSSGSGIAVAAACVPASLGTDTGGSLRHPAAACGVTALKPTHGGVSLAGTMPLSSSLDTVGPIARTARDVALVMDVIAGEDRADPLTAWAPTPACAGALTGEARGLTIARPRGYYDVDLDEEVARCLDDAVGALADAGAGIVETSPPDIELLNSLAHLVLACEAATVHRRTLTDAPEELAPQVRARIEPGLAYPATHYIEAVCRRGPLSKGWVDAAIGEADMALLPVFPVPVPTIRETIEGGDAAVTRIIGLLTRNTRAINYLGLPAVALPCGFSRSGLPIALQFVGRPWSEPLLLRMADAFQRVTDWHMRRPELGW